MVSWLFPYCCILVLHLVERLTLSLFFSVSKIPWLICFKTGGLRRTLVGLGWLGLGVGLSVHLRAQAHRFLSLSSLSDTSRHVSWQAAHFAGWPHVCVVLLSPGFVWIYACLRHRSIIPPSSFLVFRCHSFVCQYTMFNALLFCY